MTSLILSQEEIRAAAVNSLADTPSFQVGARFALAAAEKREALWRELESLTLDTVRAKELRAALGLEGVR